MDVPEQPMSENNLTRHEAAVLALLRNHPGEPVSKADISAALYTDGNLPKTNTIEVFIGRIRRKLRLKIEARRGRGYVLHTQTVSP